MQVSGATPGLWGSIAAGTKWSGNRRLTRKQSSLQIAAHADDTAKSPMWWAMKLARGLKIVRSDPRARICASWFVSIVSRSSSSLIFRSEALGRADGSVMPAICWLRHASSALGAVV